MYSSGCGNFSIYTNVLVERLNHALIETFNTQLNTTKDKDLITYNDESDFYSIVNEPARTWNISPTLIVVPSVLN